MKELTQFETMLVSGGADASCTQDNSGTWYCEADWAQGTFGGDTTFGGDNGVWVIGADGTGTFYPNP